MLCLGQTAVLPVSCRCPARPCVAVVSRQAAPSVVVQPRRPSTHRSSSFQGGSDSAAQQPIGDSRPTTTPTTSSSSSESSSGISPAAPIASGSPSTSDTQQLWLLEQFEERRRREAQAAAAAAVAAAPAGSLSARGAGGAVTNRDTSSDADVSGDTLSQQQQQAAASVEQHGQLTPGAVLQAAAQLLQLCGATAALILWPAALVPGGLTLPRVWGMWAVYVAFFSLGSVARILRHGPLSPRSKDAQTRTWQGTAALLLFIAAMPLTHWGCVLRYCRLQPQVGGVTGCDLLAALLVPGALLLHWAASRALGRAYDRVVTPEVLVTGGPYGWVQHPIYTSYMLLFAGCCLALHSVGGCLAITGVCLLYYNQRCRLEQVVLLQAFGDRYANYAAATGRFLPGWTQLVHALLPGTK